MSRAPGRLQPSDILLAAVILTAALGAVGLWAGGQLASRIHTGRWADGSFTAGLHALVDHRADPAAAWRSAMPTPGTYWTITAATTGVLIILAGLVVFMLARGHDNSDLEHREGLAEPKVLARHVGCPHPDRQGRGSPNYDPPLPARGAGHGRSSWAGSGDGPRRGRVDLRPGLRRPARPVRRRERRLRGDQPGARRPRAGGGHLHPPRRRRRHHDRPRASSARSG